MNEGRILLVALRRDGAQWIAEVSFRGKRHTMTFDSDEKDRLREVTPTPFTLTREGHEIRELAELVRWRGAVAATRRRAPRTWPSSAFGPPPLLARPRGSA